MARILLAEDDEIMRITLFDRLTSEGWDVDQAVDGKEALVSIKRNSYQLVISDIRMPGLDGVSLMNKIKEQSPETNVILMTAYGGVEDAVSCLKKGAADYIMKPFDMDDLIIRVKRFLEIQQVLVKCSVYEEAAAEDAKSKKVICNSSQMKGICQLIASIAPSDSTVLITGESGTGKEVVAAAIHAASKRANRAYIKINCAAIPESLIESELFGHEKGSFTGADQRKIGKFTLADNGTILLDEIGDLPLHLQVKLLRVIEEREVEPIGAQRPIKVDTRIICSTAKDLAMDVQLGNFRKDLYYRLKVIPVEIPPLRVRREDIPPLCDHFLNFFSRKRGVKFRLSDEASDILQSYDYPGNVRELRNILERASVLSQDAIITKDLLPMDLRANKNVITDTLNLASVIASVERETIQKALDQTGGRKAEAAQLLGISRKNLWEKIKIHNM